MLLQMVPTESRSTGFHPNCPPHGDLLGYAAVILDGNFYIKGCGLGKRIYPTVEELMEDWGDRLKEIETEMDPGKAIMDWAWAPVWKPEKTEGVSG